jgi:hypothetical protein
MLNSGQKFRALRTKKINILTLMLFEKKILNETKNHTPSPLQVKWSVPNTGLCGDSDVYKDYKCANKSVDIKFSADDTILE